MNPYVEQLEKTVRILKGMTPRERNEFVLKPVHQYGNALRVVAEYDDSDMKLFVTRYNSLGNDVLYLFGSHNEIIFKAEMKSMMEDHIVDWTIQCLEILLEESKSMEGLGFSQIGFTSHKLDDIEIWRELQGGVPVVCVSVRKWNTFSYPYKMTESVIRFMREDLPLERVMEFPSALRDRIVNGVNQ